MTHRSAITGVLGDVLHLDPTETIDEPTLRRLADCMLDLKPNIRQSIAWHGHGMTLMALITIVANEAIEAGDNALLAEALRLNAEMLDVDEQRGGTAGHA